jgi:hypothetical protein
MTVIEMAVVVEGEVWGSELAGKGKRIMTERIQCWHLRKVLVAQTTRAPWIATVLGDLMRLACTGGWPGAELASYDLRTGNLEVVPAQLEDSIRA